MRIVVVGATGNVGTSVVQALARDPQVDSVVGMARRVPEVIFDKTSWVGADITTDDLRAHFEDADAVIHLAWAIQPSRRENTLRAINVAGSSAVFEAVASAGVPALVYASSVGAYSPGPKDEPKDESWPTQGIATSFYSRHKAEVERLLDRFEQDHPSIRVVRLRPGLIFKREAASEIRRYFIGPLLPGPLVDPRFIPVVPEVDVLRFQCVHAHDVGEAYRLATTSEVRGAFNIAADPVLGAQELAGLFGARRVRVRPAAIRWAAAATWRMHLQPSPEGWVDMGFQSPIMHTTRATEELGWIPRYSSLEALVELIEGLRLNAGFPTPPLDRGAGGPLRVRELFSGLGYRNP